MKDRVAVDPKGEEESEVRKRVQGLIASLRAQEAALAKAKVDEESLKKSIQEVKEALEPIQIEREHEAEKKRIAEERLAAAKKELPAVEEVISRYAADNTKMEEDARQKTLEYEKLAEEYSRLTKQLQEHPELELWISKRVGLVRSPESSPIAALTHYCFSWKT